MGLPTTCEIQPTLDWCSFRTLACPSDQSISVRWTLSIQETLPRTLAMALTTLLPSSRALYRAGAMPRISSPSRPVGIRQRTSSSRSPLLRPLHSLRWHWPWEPQFADATRQHCREQVAPQAVASAAAAKLESLGLHLVLAVLLSTFLTAITGCKAPPQGPFDRPANWAYAFFAFKIMHPCSSEPA